MQRADQARTSQAPFVHARVRVRADVVEREHAVFRTAEHDIPVLNRAGVQLAFGEVGEGRRAQEMICGQEMSRSSGSWLSAENKQD